MRRLTIIAATLAMVAGSAPVLANAHLVAVNKAQQAAKAEQLAAAKTRKQEAVTGTTPAERADKKPVATPSAGDR